MGATIPSNKQLYDLLKSTGFDCPENLKGKTFAEATSGSGGGGSGSGITVEPITITQNGTTTAPSGKAYSPITVNVPLSAVGVKMEVVQTDKLTTVGTPVTLSYEYVSKLDANYVVWVGSEQINTRDLVADQTYNYTTVGGSYIFDITLKKESISWGRYYKVIAEFKDRGHVCTTPPLACYLIIGTLN